MTTTARNKRIVIGIMVALAALIFALDSQIPQGWTPTALYVAVVASNLWLPGLRPIWIAALACTLLTVLAFFVAPPGWANADLFNRSFSILAIWVAALFCVLYKRTERQSLELAAMVKSFGDAIISKRLDSVITSWNVGAEKLFGYTAEEVLGRSVTLLLGPEHRDEESRILEAINRGEQVAHFETERTRKDGSRVPVSLSASPIVDVGGQVVGITTIARDISKEKRAAEDLKQARAQEWFLLHTLMDNLPDRIYFKDTASRFLCINKAHATYFGLSDPAQAIGKTDFDFFAEEHARPAFEDEQEIIRTGRPLIGKEEKEVYHDGRIEWVSTTKMPFHDKDGAIIGTFGASRDITSVKRAEEALRESEERFRTFADHAADAFFLQDEQSRVLDVNRQACESLGYTRDELIGLTPAGFDPDITPAKLEDVIRKLAAGETVKFESRHRRKDGTIFPVEVRGKAFREGGRQFSVTLVRDVTDRKRAEEALREAKEAAEAASRTKSEFLASMSHEIRTPMNGVFGMLDLALEMELEPEQRHYLERARASADLLLRVINDILDFSKIEAGRLDLEPAAFSLGETLGETIKGFGPQAHRKGLELALHVRPDTPDGVVGDALRLGQVLINLVGNAVKFTDRGEVVVKAEVESVTDGQVCLHFAVADTGPGIPPDKQRLIFGAFAQADSSMARRFGGTGLGLAISARLVEMMGGRIWVESEVGKGSTFHFTACFGLGHEVVLKPKAKRIDLEAMPVLVADDNETNRHILSEMLTNWRMVPTAVGSGGAALAELKRAAAAGKPFPLVLLDAVMPEIDGFAVAQEIRRDPALAGVTIMMLSSADGAGEPARCRELGIAVYLRKPVKQSEMLDAILTALGKLADHDHGYMVSDMVPEPEATSAAPTQCTGCPAAVPGIPCSLRVLVAEDNEFNQELAASLLTKRGHVAVLVGNGKAALAAWEREPFDLILMDVQMPEMDGFAATQAIRAKESAMDRAPGGAPSTLGRGRVPIIALTAHAMKGDRERCLAAGMDAYVSKPIRAAELFEVIDRLLSADVKAAKGTPSPEGSPGAVFDLDTALSVVDGDWEILRRMAQLFLSQCPKLLGEIRDSVARGDAPALEHAAHKLKASVGSFGAQRAYQAALRLEELGDAGDLTGSKKAFPELEEAVMRLQEAVAELAREGRAGKAASE